MQQLSLWGEPPAPDRAAFPSADASLRPDGAADVPDSRPPTTESAGSGLPPRETDIVVSPPIFKPLQGAVEAGVFGISVAGPIEPDEHEIAALTQEHANELICTLVEVEALQDALRSGVDPRTGRTPRTPDAAEKSAERSRAELRLLQANYANMLAAFEEGFGSEAGGQLDTWVRGQVAGTPKRLPYDPGHPWHYYWAGDAAVPLPFEEIPPADDAGRWLERDLPKNSAKRLARLRELLTVETQRLQDDRMRYEEIATRGAEALSRFDREIAHGGNVELARASALALKYYHIRMGLGRLKWLGKELGSGRRREPIHAAQGTSEG